MDVRPITCDKTFEFYNFHGKIMKKRFIVRTLPRLERGRCGGLQTKHFRRIESLYMRMYEPLFEYACSVLRNATLAEEAVQETFCLSEIRGSV